MARKSKTKQSSDQPDLLDARVATAPCVPGIREKVKAWRDDGYKGISDTTRTLLNYWFHTDHRLPDGRKFSVSLLPARSDGDVDLPVRSRQSAAAQGLVETFATRSDLRLLQYDDFARYCVKMATGSGKTKVMSLAVAWQFFNAVAEGAGRLRQDIFGDCAKRDRVRAPADRLRGRAHFSYRSGHSSRTADFLERFPMLHARRRRASQFAWRALSDQRAAILRAPKQLRRRARRIDGGARAEAARANLDDRGFRQAHHRSRWAGGRAQ